jgi:hypothetical protein
VAGRRLPGARVHRRLQVLGGEGRAKSVGRGGLVPRALRVAGGRGRRLRLVPAALLLFGRARAARDYFELARFGLLL